MEDKIKDILVEVLEVKKEEITDSFGPENANLWDSMNNLRLITAFEEEFNIKLTMDAINKMVNFKMIKETIFNYISK